MRARLTLFTWIALATGSSVYARSPVFEPIDAYIKTKDVSAYGDLVTRMSAFEDQATTILDNYGGVARYYRAILKAAESETTAAMTSKNPYRDRKWSDYMRLEVNKFCCDLSTNPKHREIIIKWLEDWFDGKPK